MIYIDTSIVASALFADVHGPYVLPWLAAQTGNMAGSAWVETELCSVLLQKRLSEGLTREEQQRALALFRAEIKPALMIFPIVDSTFLMAARLMDLSRSKLRAPDALHVAVTRLYGLELASADLPMLAAASQFGVSTHFVGTRAN